MLGVYIVDDSQEMRQRLTELVSDVSGTEVVGQSSDPLEALDSIRKSHPDVVILDIRLPGRSGIDLLTDIKKDPAPSIVIMVTCYPHRQYRQGCMTAGADYFFSKINEFEMIGDTLKRIAVHHQPEGNPEIKTPTEGESS